MNEAPAKSAPGAQPAATRHIPLRVEVTRSEGHLLIRVLGPLDVAWSEEFLERVEPLCIHPGATLLDLHGVTLLDSAGIRALLTVKKAVEEHFGELRLLVASGTHPERVLKLVGLYDYLAPVESLEGAPGTPPA